MFQWKIEKLQITISCIYMWIVNSNTLKVITLASSCTYLHVVPSPMTFFLSCSTKACLQVPYKRVSDDTIGIFRRMNSFNPFKKWIHIRPVYCSLLVDSVRCRLSFALLFPSLLPRVPSCSQISASWFDDRSPGFRESPEEASPSFSQHSDCKTGYWYN